MIQYAVTLKNQEWTLFKDAAPVATFLTRSAAVAAAESAAFEAEAGGDTVELIVQDYFGGLTEKHSGFPI